MWGHSRSKRAIKLNGWLSTYWKDAEKKAADVKRESRANRSKTIDENTQFKAQFGIDLEQEPSFEEFRQDILHGT